MTTRRSQFVPDFSSASQPLEQRLALSGGGSAAEVATLARKAATQTTLAVSTGTIGQPITFTATVRTSASAGSPVGSVEIMDHGKVIQTVLLSPASTSNGRYAFSQGTATLSQTPGGASYYFGRHPLTAVFVPTGAFSRSTAAKSFTVAAPSYTSLADGVKIATVTTGSGAQLQSGQTANVLYTGYLEKNGKIFDDSIKDGGQPLSFTVGAGQLIKGFDEGVVGMKVGETRAILIPPAEGYGKTTNGPIPGNSTLVFVVTLVSSSS